MQKPEHMPRTALRNRRAPVAALAVLLVGTIWLPGSQAFADEPDCDIPAGALTQADIPEGTSAVECDLVGRTVFNDEGDAGITVPDPGTAVGSESIGADGDVTVFQLEVSEEGVLSFPDESVDSEDSSGSVTSAAASPGECVDQAYSTNDLKEYDIYNWYVGDGGMPGALSQSAAASAFADAINNITGSTNSCSYSDQVEAQSSYQGTTTYEADIDSSGTCTARDEQSTWDAGDLGAQSVAKTCWWAWALAGAKNDLREADVRYNTTDFNFTNNPASGCYQDYDVRSVGTHEAGHVFGMGHVGAGHTELTMHTASFWCTAKARTLGVGDVLGLRSIY